MFSAPNCKMAKTESMLLLNIKYMVWIYSGHTKSVDVHFKYLSQKLISPPQSESRRSNERKFLLSPKRKCLPFLRYVQHSLNLPVAPHRSHLCALGFLMYPAPSLSGTKENKWKLFQHSSHSFLLKTDFTDLSCYPQTATHICGILDTVP